MPLNAATLKNEIIAQLAAKGFQTTNEHSKIQEMAEAIATAVVTHIVTNAVVTTSVTGVTAGGATVGGTGTIT